MLALLRHFAETFGPDEIYRQARTIYLETPEGAREIQEEYARVRDEDPLGTAAPLPAPARGIGPTVRTGRSPAAARRIANSLWCLAAHISDRVIRETEAGNKVFLTGGEAVSRPTAGNRAASNISARVAMKVQMTIAQNQVVSVHFHRPGRVRRLRRVHLLPAGTLPHPPALHRRGLLLQHRACGRRRRPVPGREHRRARRTDHPPDPVLDRHRSPPRPLLPPLGDRDKGAGVSRLNLHHGEKISGELSWRYFAVEEPHERHQSL